VVCLVDNYPPAGQPKVHQPHPFTSPKMQTSLIADGDTIEIPPESTSPAHQGSLVVVIGKAARNISRAEASSLVFGVGVGNDVSELDWLNRVGGLAVPDRILAKGCDTWGPIGTDIVTGIDYNNLLIETRVNGQVCASGRTSEMNNNVNDLIYYINHYMTLLPGDLIYTGAPVAMEGKANIKPGDTVEVSIENVGKVTNRVAAGAASPDAWWVPLAEELKATQAQGSR
jgi:2-keto-4-pentenoate hydratase/2-oxohepta-3-ene-1,7-dioic acid hydratase in catechol pathway